MTNAEFIERAFSDKGPKIINGFSRPIYHNWMGFCHGHKYSKSGYGGMIRHSEGAMLREWARRLKPGSVIVEIGCYGGLSTSYMASACIGRDIRIFAIDPFGSDLDQQAEMTDGCVALKDKPTIEMVRQRMKENGFNGFVELIEGYSQEVIKTWETKIDFLWIDGNHDQAYQDFVDWSPMLNPGARVGIHDAHPRYGIKKVAEDARRIFSSDEWKNLEHVKGILTATLKR